MVSVINDFKELVGEIYDLNATQGLLGWDLETHMPPLGGLVRAKQMATLSKLSHELMTSKTMGQYLTTLRDKKQTSLSALDKALIREVGKEYDRAVKLPVKLVQEMTEVAAQAHPIWVNARKNKNFKQFVPTLKKVIDLNQQMANALGFKGSPYNALLDLYEPDLTTSQIDPLFKRLRQDLVPLVKAIGESPHQPDTRFLKRISNLDKQWVFSLSVIEKMGFDMQAGRLDKAAHPFCMGMGPGDVRLTTRLFKNDLVSCLFSAMHEAGHGLYEQGSDPELNRTPLTGGASLGIHESQSRLWENIVGRGLPFWKHFYPKLKTLFSAQLKGVSLNQFYHAINQSRPSYIRVEADEATYNLHIMLRYEIENDLIEGRLKVEDTEQAWNDKMQAYFNLTPRDAAEGVLQDVHWAHGSFGYFPTYTLGNLYSVQFYNAAKTQLPSLETQITRGNLKPLKTWLNEQIHWVSKVETPTEIVQRVTGESLNPQPFIDYLWEKYGTLYKLVRS